MKTPYFYLRNAKRAEIVIHDTLPGHRMTFTAWKVLRSISFRVECPEFMDVDLNVFRHLEDAFRMMTQHAAKVIESDHAVGGGMKVDVDWSEGNNYATLPVFPKSKKYIIVLERDELDNVTITSPKMTFSDLPSLNQARRVCGQVVGVVTSMRRGG